MQQADVVDLVRAPDEKRTGDLLRWTPGNVVNDILSVVLGWNNVIVGTFSEPSSGFSFDAGATSTNTGPSTARITAVPRHGERQ
jgi:hypothetical protein